MVSRQMKHILTSVSRNDGSVPAFNQSGKLLDTPMRFDVAASNDPSVLHGARDGCRSMTSHGSCLTVKLTEVLPRFVYWVFPLK